MTEKKPLILIAEDDTGYLCQLQGSLEEEGYRVLTAHDGSEAIKILQEHKVDMGLIDLWMPGVGGMEALEQARDIAPDVPLVMITSKGSFETAVQAIKVGAYDYLAKKAGLNRILITVQKALEKRTLQQQARWMAQDIMDRYKMVGHSAAMQKIYDQIDKAAATDSTVLISGETGTGKELVAMAIHWRSRRNVRPCLTVNCPSIDKSLAVSELFGHKKGAFTGADYDHDGKFLQADGSTIFLDEIGDLDLGVQSKILRVLDDHVVERVGDTVSREVDVRVLAATNKVLPEMIDQGKFREDLYYRINAINIHLPPLRERFEDIPELADFYLRRYCEKLNHCLMKFDPQAMHLIVRHGWRGNVRELKWVIERTVPNVQGERVTAAAVAEALSDQRQTIEQSLLSYREAMNACEKDYFNKVLIAHDWNVSATAATIGLDRTNLHKKMQRLGITRDGIENRGIEL